jgi:hypothetical protein
MHHPRADWTLARLQAYVGTTETLTLEFKSMRALIVDEKKDKDAKLSEAARDVAGMANEQGGFIIYGIDEEAKGPFRRARAVEEGFGHEHKVSREWFLQFIRDRVQPPLTDIDAIDVPLGDEHFALVVLVPQARGIARQTGDGIFWRRDAQGLRRMSVQEIEDVRSRTIKPRIELRLAPSPGQVSAERLAEIGVNIELRNVSAATATFAVVTVGLGRRAEARFLSNPEWRWERTDDNWKIARTVIASGTSSRWSPITPGLSLMLQGFTLLVRVDDQDFVGPPRGIGLIRLDSDGGATVYRLSFNAVFPERSTLRLDRFEGPDDPYMKNVGQVPDMFMTS